MRQLRRNTARAATLVLAGAMLSTGGLAHAALDENEWKSDAQREEQESNNLLINGSFEEGDDVENAPGWSVLWGRAEVVALSDEQASEGTRSLRINRDEEGRTGGYAADAVPVDVGERYELSFDQYLLEGALSAVVYFYDGNGDVVSQPFEMVRTATHSWERATAHFAAPSNAVAASPTLYATSGVTVDTYLDDVFFGLATGEQPETSFVDQILEQDDNLEYLGTPVTSQIPSQAAPGFEDGRHVSYQVFKGEPDTPHPATFVVTDIETGERISTCSVDGAEHVRNLNVATDGTVYWGTYYDSRLWSYDPGTSKCRDLGRFDEDIDSNQHSFGLSPGPNGSMFIGIYPDTRLYQFNPETDEIEFLQEVDANESYIHAIAYNETDDSVYVGTGGKEPNLWKIADAGRGEPSLIADETTVPGISTNAQWISRLDIVDNRIIAQVGLTILVLELDGTIVRWDPEQTRTHFGHHTIPGAQEGTAIFSGEGGQLMEYDINSDTIREMAVNIGDYLSHGVIDDSSGIPLLYGTSAKGVFVADLINETLVSNNQIEFAQPTLIQKLFAGPQNSIWASGYLLGLAEVDKTGDEHGATMNLGQFESGVVRDEKLYLGAYGNARLDELDPATFDPNDTTSITRLFNGQDEGQDRPNGIAYNPERDEIYLGSVAGYGQTQGGLAIWEGSTGEHIWFTEEIGENENIVSVAFNDSDGMVYLGSTIYGGLGSDPSGNASGKLIVFDPETRTVVDTMDPAGTERQGVTGLMVDDSGAVWGVAEQSLFRYDPQTGDTEIRGSVGAEYQQGVARWSYGSTHQSAKDGNIYVTAGGRFSVHDPVTNETRLIGTGFGWSVTDETGDVYISADSNLFRYNVEEPAEESTEDPTAEPTEEATDEEDSGVGGTVPEDETDADDAEGAPLKDLPRTGTAVGVAVLLSLVLFTLGALLVLRRRRLEGEF